MTPQLQQAIRLLQLSSLELQTEIQDALESNMMLELAEEEPAPGNGAGGAEENQAKSSDNDSELSEINDDISSENIPEDLPVDSDWNDIYESVVNFGGSREPLEFLNFENQDTREKTLRDHLMWQLNLTPTTETDKVIAMAIIDALDDDGYMSYSTADILLALGDDMEVEIDEVEAVLNLVQAMDPAGVGARDLEECLTLQLGQCDASTPWLEEARELVRNYLSLLASHDYNQLMRRLKLSREDLSGVVTLIQSMNPRPGNQIQDAHIQYIAPDVYVR